MVLVSVWCRPSNIYIFKILESVKSVVMSHSSIANLSLFFPINVAKGVSILWISKHLVLVS